MRFLNKLGAGIIVAGLVVVMAGGMGVRHDSSGTWVQVNPVHAVGGGMLLCGAVLTAVAAFASGPSAKAVKDEGVDSAANR